MAEVTKKCIAALFNYISSINAANASRQNMHAVEDIEPYLINHVSNGIANLAIEHWQDAVKTECGIEVDTAFNIKTEAQLKPEYKGVIEALEEYLGTSMDEIQKESSGKEKEAGVAYG